jgi:polysaccharide export outer membrane protein
MRYIACLLIALLLPACSQTWEDRPPSSEPGGTSLLSDGTTGNGNGHVSSVSELPARTEEGVRQPYGSSGEFAAYEFGNGYKIGAGDRLSIKVVGEADLTGDYIVDPTGNISLPYVRTIPVAGLTTLEVEKLLASKLRNGYLRNPNLSVQLATLRPFFILGEVNTAGSFDYQPGMTVQNAIAIAGGYSPRADQGAVMLTRKNVKGTATYKAPVTTQLYPGDIVYVRERWF